MELIELLGETIRIKFLQDVELQVISEVVDDKVVSYNEIFRKDDVKEVDVVVVDEENQTLDIQFGNGEVVSCLSPALFVLEQVVREDVIDILPSTGEVGCHY